MCCPPTPPVCFPGDPPPCNDEADDSVGLENLEIIEDVCSASSFEYDNVDYINNPDTPSANSDKSRRCKAGTKCVVGNECGNNGKK